MSRGSEQALRRRFLLAGTVVGLVALLAIVGLAEGLRHPPPVEPVDQPLADPRDEVVCPEEELGEEEPDGESDEQGPQLEPATPPTAVTSSDLLDCPESYNRQVVRYQGEVVGGVFHRDGGAWTQLNDDAYADPVDTLPAHRSYRGGNSGVGVFLPEEVAGQITTVGGPRARGDLLDVVGVFQRADPTTQEVAVIRVVSGEVVRAGRPLSDVRLRDREVAAAVLVLLAFGTVVTERVIARRRERY